MATRIAVMNGGVIQQIATPDEIYERPANLFVARFIGSPAMNTLKATIERENGMITAVHAPTGVRMDLSCYPFRATPTQGAAIIVGLRPEHFSIGRRGTRGAGARFTLPALYTEKTGSDVTAFLDGKNGEMIAVRFDHKQHHVPASGEVVEIRFPHDRFDVFDAVSEERI